MTSETTTLDTGAAIATARLLLRRPDERDVADMARLANNWNVVCNTSRLPFPYREEHARAFIAILEHNRGDGSAPFSVCLDDGKGSFIGVCGYGAPEGHIIRELGYWLGEPYWGSGFATEVVSAVVAHAFTSHPHVTEMHADYQVGNHASGAVLRKCGFEIVGEGEAYSLANGKNMPLVHVSLRREAWQRTVTESQDSA